MNKLPEKVGDYLLKTRGTTTGIKGLIDVLVKQATAIDQLIDYLSERDEPETSYSPAMAEAEIAANHQTTA